MDSIEERNLTIVEAWKNYTIMDCITNASSAIKQLRVSTLNACWKAMWPECVKSGNSVPQKSIECSEIITLSHAIGGEGFDNMQSADIDELLIDKPIDDEDLIELMTYCGSNENPNNEDEGKVKFIN